MKIAFLRQFVGQPKKNLNWIRNWFIIICFIASFLLETPNIKSLLCLLTVFRSFKSYKRFSQNWGFLLIFRIFLGKIIGVSLVPTRIRILVSRFCKGFKSIFLPWAHVGFKKSVNQENQSKKSPKPADIKKFLQMKLR